MIIINVLHYRDEPKIFEGSKISIYKEVPPAKVERCIICYLILFIITIRQKIEPRLVEDVPGISVLCGFEGNMADGL